MSAGPRFTLGCMRQVTYIDTDLARPALILDCERLPFVLLLGAVVFLLVVVFGVNLHGLIASGLLMAIGIGMLRRAARYDPYFFAVAWQALQYPRALPPVPREHLPRMPFVGYGAAPRLPGSLRANPDAR